MHALGTRDQVDDSSEVNKNEPRKILRADSILHEIENPCSPRGNTNDGKPGEVCTWTYYLLLTWSVLLYQFKKQKEKK